jgi:hypothetical protein
MADYDSNMIKPVNGLKNVAGLTSVKHREERQRRRQFSQQDEEKDQTGQGQETLPKEQAGDKTDINSDDIGIDYCA